jgi:menaquinone-dependent protoporphyrinogen oxidase
LKALVAFGTRYGSTARVASAIAEELKGRGYQVEVWDLRQQADDVERFDLVVLGSGIIVGRWSKEAREFIASNATVLAKKRVALFASCSDVLFPEKVENARKVYLQDVAASVPTLAPVSLGLFGGEVDFSKYGALTKMLLKGAGTRKTLEARGVDCSKPYDFRDWETVRAWARAL